MQKTSVTLHSATTDLNDSLIFSESNKTTTPSSANMCWLAVKTW